MRDKLETSNRFLTVLNLMCRVELGKHLFKPFQNEVPLATKWKIGKGWKGLPTKHNRVLFSQRGSSRQMAEVVIKIIKVYCPTEKFDFHEKINKRHMFIFIYFSCIQKREKKQRVIDV